MSRARDCVTLLKQGFDPKRISHHLGISLNSVLGYLDRAVGEGLIRRSDIYFAFSPDHRSSPNIVKRYGSARVAFGDLYDDLRRIEVNLHTRIRETLIQHYGDSEAGWWRQGVPEAVRGKCRERHKRDPDKLCHPYCYTDLMDLAKIIEAQWALFKELFPTCYSSNRKALLDALNRLNRIRNKVMHPVRGVAPVEGDFDFVHQLERNLVPRSSA